MDALVVAVDVQRAFVADERVTDRITDILDCPAPHVLTRFVNEPDSPFAAQLDYTTCGSDDPDVRLHPSVEPYRENALGVLDKCAYSAARADGFIDIVDAVDPDRTYVCGLETDACVYATALDLFDRGYAPRVVRDACATAGDHDAVVDSLARNIGEENVVETAAVVESGL